MAYQNPNFDLDDLGVKIERIIDQAVNSHDFQRLNQTIRQTVGRAVDSGSEAFRKVKENTSQSMPKPPHYNRVYRGTVEPTLPVLYASTTNQKAKGILRTVFGGIATGLSTAGLVGYTVVDSLLLHAGIFSAGGILSFGAVAGGIALLVSGIRSQARLKRFEAYKKMLGSRTYCDIKRLASGVGLPAPRVRKELKGMINDGLFLEGHLDAEETSLITSHDTYRHYQQAQKQLAEKQRLELEEQRKAQQRLDAVAGSPAQEVLEKGNAFIREIRRCNDAIPGFEMTEKISHMEMIVGKIFDRAETHPEIVPDLKKMMDYYLPMTVKLLRAYAEMDAQPIQGDTIQASKREIEDTLDTLNNAFEKLLDSVFKETAMDVSSDISVLQTLLAQEGLAEDELMKMKKDSQATTED